MVNGFNLSAGPDAALPAGSGHPKAQTYCIHAPENFLGPRGVVILVETSSGARLSHEKIHLRTKLVPAGLPTIWTVLEVIRGQVMIKFINLKLQSA